MKNKVYQARLNLKSGPLGEFEAVFATLNLVDKDGDLTVPGAFGRQKCVVEKWNHGHDLPTGQADIFERGNEAIAAGRFFLDTQAGRDHYQTIKNLGPLTEWSYSFTVDDSGPGSFGGRSVRVLRKMTVSGIAPVTRGAGENTRTTQIKRRSGLSAEAMIRELDTRMKIAEIGEMCAAADSTQRLLERLDAAEKMFQKYAQPSRKSEPVPVTNFANLVRSYQAEGMSPALAEAWALGALDRMVFSLASADMRGGIDENFVQAEARARVEKWARQPADRIPA